MEKLILVPTPPCHPSVDFSPVIHPPQWTHRAGNTLQGEASRGTMRHPWCAAPCTKECFSVSVRRGMFHPCCAWGGEFIRLASLWSTDNQWLGSQQPLRYVARFVTLSTLAVRRGCHAAPWLASAQVYSQLNTEPSPLSKSNGKTDPCSRSSPPSSCKPFLHHTHTLVNPYR